MKKLTLLLIVLLNLGCVKDELPELGTNVFDNSETDFFQLVDVSFEFYSTIESNITVTFESNCDDMTADQKNQLDMIYASGPGASFAFSLDRNFFKVLAIRTGEEVCYNIGYLLKSGEGVGSSKFCFEVE